MEKMCSNCRHEHKKSLEEPCNTCVRINKLTDNWEPAFKTNGDKFKEVFGVDVDDVDNHITSCQGIKCPSRNIHCVECEYHDFWKKEYKEKTNDD